MDIVNLPGMALIPTVVMIKGNSRAVVDIDKQGEWIARGYNREGDGPTPTEGQVDETPANALLANKDGAHVLTDPSASDDPHLDSDEGDE